MPERKKKTRVPIPKGPGDLPLDGVQVPILERRKEGKKLVTGKCEGEIRLFIGRREPS